jgi:hypothetical protein
MGVLSGARWLPPSRGVIWAHCDSISTCLGQYIQCRQHTCSNIRYIRYMHIWIHPCMHIWIHKMTWAGRHTFVCLLKIHIFTIAWSPIPEPSCLHTTTYSHPHCLLICHRLLSQKSADSLCMAKGIVPVAPKGTRGRRPSMEETGITHKTCDCSWRS